MANCMGIWGALFGHKYEAFYNRQKGSVDPATIKELNSNSSCAIVEGELAHALQFVNSSKSEYVYHVCPRCGDTIRKEESR